MSEFPTWFSLVLEVLTAGEDECLGLIRSSGGGRARGAVVDLVEGPTSSEEALLYARVLLEIGRGAEAEEVVRAVIAAELGGVGPQGSQVRVDVPQGDQLRWVA